MPIIRSIGRWSLVALMVNSIIGSGIFGVPGKLIASLGRASPVAMILAGLLMAVIVLCFAEVGSRFSEQGGVYLYSRTAFGRLVGLQVGWFYFLSAVGSTAANAHLFVAYLGGFAPWLASGWPSLVVIAALLALPTAANYVGTRKGTLLCSALTIAKLTPLALLIGLGLVRFSRHAQVPLLSEITAPGWGAWGNALLMLIFVFGGFEDPMAPAGEVKEPGRNIPFSLLTSLAACTVIYTLLQFVVVATDGGTASDRPLALAAHVLLGRGGALLVEIAAMVSIYGWISGTMLNVPRVLFSLSSKGDFPSIFRKLHPRYNTPHKATVIFAVLALVLTATGTFKWSLLVSAGAGTIYYLIICAAVVRLRQVQPGAEKFRLPFGPAFSVAGVAICLALLSQLETREAMLMTITAVVALANWWWARKQTSAAFMESPLEVEKPDGATAE